MLFVKKTGHTHLSSRTHAPLSASPFFMNFFILSDCLCVNENAQSQSVHGFPFSLAAKMWTVCIHLLWNHFATLMFGFGYSSSPLYRFITVFPDSKIQSRTCIAENVRVKGPVLVHGVYEPLKKLLEHGPACQF